MKLSTVLRRFATAVASVLLLLVLCGCNGDTTSCSPLDTLNTIFLGITAAGAIALIKNV